MIILTLASGVACAVLLVLRLRDFTAALARVTVNTYSGRQFSHMLRRADLPRLYARLNVLGRQGKGRLPFPFGFLDIGNVRAVTVSREVHWCASGGVRCLTWNASETFWSAWGSLIERLMRDLSPSGKRPLSATELADFIAPLVIDEGTVAEPNFPVSVLKLCAQADLPEIVECWRAHHASPPRNVTERVYRLRQCVAALGEMVLREDRTTFFTGPHPLIRNQRPINLLRTKKGFREVMQQIEGADSGSYA